MPYINKQDLYEAQKRRWNRQKAKAVQYLGGVCQDCNQTFHPAAYDFHHRDPNDKEVAWNKLRLRSWDKITLELDKCDLLCCICHRLRHIRDELWEVTPEGIEPTSEA